MNARTDSSLRTSRCTPWRPPLFEALASRTARTALHLRAPPPKGQAYLRAFLDEPDRWQYAVVDEMVDKMVGIIVAPWPCVDEKGRLRQNTLAADDARGATYTVHVPVDDFHSFLLFQRRRARSLGLIQGDHAEDAVTRAVRIGDAFALVASPTKSSQPASTPRGRLWARVEGRRRSAVWLRGVARPTRGGRTAVVLDLGVDAREAARAAYSAAMAPLLDREVDHEIIAGAVLEGLDEAAERAARARG